MVHYTNMTGINGADWQAEDYRRPAGPINPEAIIRVIAGEQTTATVSKLMFGMMNAFGIEIEQLQNNVAIRILSNGQITKENAAKAVATNGVTPVLVKEPGVTPSEEQVIAGIMELERNGMLLKPPLAAEEQARGWMDQEQIDEIAKIRTEIQKQNNLNEQEPLSEEALRAFATQIVAKGIVDKAFGSPNGVWRSQLKATLMRGTDDRMTEYFKLAAPHQGEIDVISREEKVLKNPEKSPDPDDPSNEIFKFNDDVEEKYGASHFLEADEGEYVLAFTDNNTGKITRSAKTKKLKEKDSRIRFYTDSENAVKDWANAELAQYKDDDQVQFVHATKQTVVKETDNALLDGLDGALKELGQSGKIFSRAQEIGEDGQPTLNRSILIDNVFGQLASASWSKDTNGKKTVVVAPNGSYASFASVIKGFVENRQKNQITVPKHSQIMRASATGDLYSQLECKAESEGVVKLQKVIRDEDGKITGYETVAQQDVKAGDVVMTNFLDRQSVRSTLEQMLKYAVDVGYKHNTDKETDDPEKMEMNWYMGNFENIWFTFADQQKLDENNPGYYRIFQEELVDLVNNLYKLNGNDKTISLDDIYVGADKIEVPVPNSKNETHTVKISIKDPVQAAIDFYTTPDAQDIILAMNNGNGDFATDMEVLGTGTTFSNAILETEASVKLRKSSDGFKLPDLRYAFETGSLGTAPDLIDLWKKEGRLVYNPMAFVLAYAYSARESGRLILGGNGNVENLPSEQIDRANYMLALGDALETSVFKTIKNGLVPPILIYKDMLQDNIKENAVAVSTHTFLASVQYEALAKLNGINYAVLEDVAEAKKNLDVSLNLDKAINELQDIKSDELDSDGNWKTDPDKETRLNRFRENNIIIGKMQENIARNSQPQYGNGNIHEYQSLMADYNIQPLPTSDPSRHDNNVRYIPVFRNDMANAIIQRNIGGRLEDFDKARIVESLKKYMGEHLGQFHAEEFGNQLDIAYPREGAGMEVAA